MQGTLTHKVHSQVVVVVVLIVVFLLGGGELQSGHFLNAQGQNQSGWLGNFTGPKQAQNSTFSFGLPPFAKTHNNLTETEPNCSDDPSVVCNVLPSVIPFQPPPHQNQAAPRNETTTYPPTPICMYGPVIECTTPPPNTMFSAGPCDSPLFAHFYRNVLTRHVQGCTATSPPFKLNSGKEVTIAGPGSGHKRVL